ncbi:MAG TPA: anion transporter [Candidatus Latescibacteria bacterium]|nr:anion transporter [Candidatus Latescibacterota bacterium]
MHAVACAGWTSERRYRYIEDSVTRGTLHRGLPVEKWPTLVIFAATYIGVAVGRVPGLQIDRTGIALMGAICMVLVGQITVREALDAVDFPTILLLYALMVVSAQFRLGGFYTWVAGRVAGLARRPVLLLAALISVSAVLSALVANDIVCLAFTPVLCIALQRAGLNPVPYLLALACATNIGSAATIIGNPQNMLIGQVGRLHFDSFLFWCAPPSIVGLLVVFGVCLLSFPREFLADGQRHGAGSPNPPESLEGPPDFGGELDAHQTLKGIIITIALVAAFFTSIPREVSGLAAAALLLASRKIHSRAILGFVDWHLITLFCALFIVVHGIEAGGFPAAAVAALKERGIRVGSLPVLGTVAVILSNLVSNVPAVMLLIGQLPQGNPVPWYVLALTSTLAGNLILVGSIANLIVVEQAEQQGVHVSFAAHARVGVPVTLITLAFTWLWIGLALGVTG